MRDILIQSCAERVIDHASSNGGRCHHGFVQGIVGELYQGAPLMGMSGLVTRGWNPYNQNTLDCAQILATTPDSVQEEHDSILQSRGITLNHTTRSVLYSQQDLFAVGFGHLAGGADAGQRIANTVASVTLSGYTASRIMS